VRGEEETAKEEEKEEEKEEHGRAKPTVAHEDGFRKINRYQETR
jgi:hypothetical protein